MRDGFSGISTWSSCRSSSRVLFLEQLLESRDQLRPARLFRLCRLIRFGLAGSQLLFLRGHALQLRLLIANLLLELLSFRGIRFLRQRGIEARGILRQ